VALWLRNCPEFVGGLFGIFGADAVAVPVTVINRDEIERTGQWLLRSAYAPEPSPITRALIEDGRQHLLFGAPIEPGCPVTILQGMQDEDVPWQHAMTLMEHLPADDVTLTFVRDGDHRLSRPQDIALLIAAVAAMAGR
jgi:pimeloyl-ACP methyl ester carboxylesterase